MRLARHLLVSLACLAVCGAQAQPDAAARSLEELSKVWFKAMDASDYAAAEKAARERLRLSLESFPESANHESLLISLRYLGEALSDQGRFAEAEPTLRRAVQVGERGKVGGAENPETQLSRIALANALLEINRYAEVEALLKAAIEGLAAHPDWKRPRARAAYLLGRLYQELARRTDAEAQFRQAIEIEEARAQRKPTVHIGLSLWRIAQLRNWQGKRDEAIKLSQQAIEVLEAVFGKNHFRTLWPRRTLAEAFNATKRHAEAQAQMELAIPIWERNLGERDYRVGWAYRDLGAAFAGQDKLEQAANAYGRVAEIGKISGVPELALYGSLGLGRALAKSAEPERALPHYREAMELFGRQFDATSGLDDQSRLSYASRFAAVHYELLNLLIRLHKEKPQAKYDREAFSVLSLAQSRLFVQMLRQSNARLAERDPTLAALAQRQRAADARIGELRQATATLSARKGAEADLKREQLALEIAKQENTRLTAEVELWRKYPRFMEVTLPQPVTADDLQAKVLQPGDLLLAYALFFDRVVVFAATREKIVIAEGRATRRAIAEQVRRVRAVMDSVGATGTIVRLPKLDPADLHALYQAALAPVEDLLTGAKRVFVVADGPLFTLPFELFVQAWGDADKRAFEAARAKGPPLSEYATLRYAGQRAAFSYLPAVAALASQRLNPRLPVTYDRSLVSFADPVFGPEGDSKLALAPEAKAALTTLGPKVRGRGTALELPRLADTGNEAREIAKTIGGVTEIRLRLDAQEHALKTLDLTKTRYLHFATHGLLGGDFLGFAAADAGGRATQAQPALALTLVGNLGGEDGLLTVRDIAESLDLNAELVVLSACNTAGEIAEAQTGEGFVGLTRAFMYAGARALVVSHWSVESATTNELVAGMFRGIKDGKPAAESLRNAAASIRGDKRAAEYSRAHPYFWAPFVHVGD